MKRKLWSTISVIAIITLSACTAQNPTTSPIPSKTISSTVVESTTTKPETTQSAKPKEESGDKKESHLDYNEQEEWEFKSGQSQSPINIDTTTAVKMKNSGDIILSYESIIKDVDDNGHSIQVDDSGEATINGRVFSLAQLHFHSPSEHTLDGKSFPIEGHFVNKQEDGRIAVIGVFFEEGETNEAFGQVLSNIIAGEKNEKSTEINVMNLLPKNKSYYHYLGSLTTPPLTENVEWYIMQDTVKVSKEQIEQFNKHYEGNNRKIQDLNGRVITKHESK